MGDVFDSAKRSAVMAAITGRGNRSTESRLVALMRAAGITGWRRHVDLPGRPDFAFRQARVVVFVDGCFWHGCPLHYKPPSNHSDFWARKLQGNRRRDRRVTRELRGRGWIVLRIWEHDLVRARADLTVRKIAAAVRRGLCMRRQDPRDSSSTVYRNSGDKNTR